MFLLLTLVIFSSMLFSGCQNEFLNAPIAYIDESNYLKSVEKSEDPGIKTLIEYTENYTLSVHYPVTGFRFIDQSLVQFVENRMALYHQEIAQNLEQSDELTPYELHLTFETIHRSNRHITFFYIENKYIGGLQNSQELFTFNFNLDTQRELGLKDLFEPNEPFLDALSELSYDAILENAVLSESPDLNWVKSGLMPIEKNFSHFGLSEDYLILWFDRYQIGPAFMGIPSIQIPYEEIGAYVTFKEVTLSDIRDAFESALISQPSGSLSIEDDKQFNIPTDHSVQPTARKKRIALTFEAGPHPIYTPIVLDTLNTRNIKSTFFFIGNRVREYPHLVRRTFLDGHLIGNHSYDHPQMNRLNQSDMIKQIERTQEAIYNASLFESYLMRPPYGSFNTQLIETANMPLILWSINPQDNLYQDPDYIVSYVIDHAHDGGIIRLHDGYATTTQAVGMIVDALTEAGYEFVTIGELLDINGENASDNLRTYSRGFQ